MKIRVILSVFVFAGATALFANRSVSDEKPAGHRKDDQRGLPGAR